jgi:hypothetical protein
VLTGTGAFIVQGTFEEPGVVTTPTRDGGTIYYPSRKFLMFDAPITCLQFVTKWYPKYYGHLVDGRLVYSWENDGYGLYYTNYNQVLFSGPDAGAAVDAGIYYFLSNNTTTVPYTSPISLTPFPTRTNIVFGEVDSRSTTVPVGTGNYLTGSNQQGLVAVGNIALSGELSPNDVRYESADGGLNYSKLNSSELDGNFDVRLFTATTTSFDAGITAYPDGGLVGFDGGISSDAGVPDAGSLSGSFVAVPCSF